MGKGKGKKGGNKHNGLSFNEMVARAKKEAAPPELTETHITDLQTALRSVQGVPHPDCFSPVADAIAFYFQKKPTGVTLADDNYALDFLSKLYLAIDKGLEYVIHVTAKGHKQRRMEVFRSFLGWADCIETAGPRLGYMMQLIQVAHIAARQKRRMIEQEIADYVAIDLDDARAEANELRKRLNDKVTYDETSDIAAWQRLRNNFALAVKYQWATRNPGQRCALFDGVNLPEVPEVIVVEMSALGKDDTPEGAITAGQIKDKQRGIHENVYKLGADFGIATSKLYDNGISRLCGLILE